MAITVKEIMVEFYLPSQPEGTVLADVDDEINITIGGETEDYKVVRVDLNGETRLGRVWLVNS